MWKLLTIAGTFLIGFFLGYKRAFRDDDSDYEVETRCVVFQLTSPDAKKICIAGEFNNWDPEIDELFDLGDGKWGVTLYLAPGRYQYKFVIDGRKWVEDPASIETEDDGYGGRRSIIYVE